MRPCGRASERRTLLDLKLPVHCPSRVFGFPPVFLSDGLRDAGSRATLWNLCRSTLWLVPTARCMLMLSSGGWLVGFIHWSVIFDQELVRSEDFKSPSPDINMRGGINSSVKCAALSFSSSWYWKRKSPAAGEHWTAYSVSHPLSWWCILTCPLGSDFISHLLIASPWWIRNFTDTHDKHNSWYWFKRQELAHQVSGDPAVISQLLSPWDNYLTSWVTIPYLKMQSLT